MKTIMILAKRNMSIYLKNRGSVFFSILSTLIIIGLNVLFLGKLQVDNIIYMTAVEKEKATYLVNTWVMSGIIVTNAVTVTMTMIGIMVQDEDEKKLAGFLVSPLSRFKLTLGYVASAFIMGTLFCIVTLIISQVIVVLTGGNLLPLVACLKIVGLIIVNVFTAASFIFLIAVFVHSTSAFSALSTVVGTLIGFVAGIYLPMGLLPEMVQKVLKFFPVLYGTALIRDIYVEDAIKTVFNGLPSEAVAQYKEYMGITLYWGKNQVSALYEVLILLGSGVIFILLATFILGKRKGKDR